MGALETLQSDLLRLAYHLALAVLVGGGLVVGAVAAPAIFRAAPSRAEAADIFGVVLARFDSVAVPALALLLLTSFLRMGAFGEELADGRVLIRWAALALMALAVLFGSFYASPVGREIRRQTPGFADLPAGDPRRREFAKMHARSRAALTLVVIFGLIVLYLS